MKQLFLIVSLLTMCNYCSSQNIGIGTTTPASTAILDIRSNTKGVLLPRMTKAERDNIVAPSFGLLIFQTNERRGLYYNAGNAILPNWEKIGGEQDTLVIGHEAFAKGLYFEEELTLGYSKYISSSGSGPLLASVQLPAGAVVSKMIVYYYDENDNKLIVRLQGIPLDDEHDALDTPFYFSSTTAQTNLQKAAITGTYTIQSNLYSYIIKVWMNHSNGTDWSGSAQRIRAVALVYEH